MFNTGQRDAGSRRTSSRAAHAAGGRVLLDVYHSLGVLPVDVAALDVDFAVGGSYKYLRGGPGACFLYLHPRHLDGGLRTLDTGWFAKRDRRSPTRVPTRREFAAGGDAFLESTPPVLPIYQARAGQRVHAGARRRARCARIRCGQQRAARGRCSAERGIAATGGTDDRGAFVTVVDDRAAGVVATRSRGAASSPMRAARALRLCPDVLTHGRPNWSRPPTRSPRPQGARALDAGAAMIGRTMTISATTKIAATSTIADDDHLVRPDRHGVPAHRLALADAEEAREHRADDLGSVALRGGGSGVGGAESGRVREAAWERIGRSIRRR